MSDYYDKSAWDRLETQRSQPTQAQYNSLLEAMLACGADPNYRSYSRQTSILHSAAGVRLNVQAIRLLIQAGADVDAINGYGYGVLHSAAAAAAWFQKPSDLERLRVLVEEAGCSRGRANSWNITPLAAALNMNPKIGAEIRELLAPDMQNGTEAMALLKSTRTTATRRLTIRLEDEPLVVQHDDANQTRDDNTCQMSSGSTVAVDAQPTPA